MIQSFSGKPRQKSDLAKPRNMSAKLRDHMRNFRQDESGTAMVLTLFFFLFMIIAAGLAIDSMRHEMERARLQNTLDAAVLAAAGSPADADARAIIEDYFETAGMSNYLDAEKDGDIVRTLNTSKVSASASMELDTYLMRLAGVDTLAANGASTAETRTPKLEVVMVLDVSGSMNSNSKLTNLKTAAKEFVTTLLSASDPGDTVISVVPFSWAVSPTQAMFDGLAVDEKHQYSTCIRFKENAHNHASLTPGNSAFSNGKVLDQMIYTAVYGGFDNFGNSGWRSCFAQDNTEIQPFSFSETTLHTKIDALTAGGNTSGDQGMNWGAALLDPTFRDLTDDLILAGEMDASLTNVPSNYDEAETLKIIVMMGDGQNTSSYFFSNGGTWRGQNSDLYLMKSQEQVFQYAYHKYKKNKISYSESKCGKKKWECVYDTNGPIESTYYLRDGNQYYNIDDEYWISNSQFSDLQDDDSFVSLDRLTWEEAWGLMTPEFYGDVTGDYSAHNDYLSNSLNGSAKDTRMAASCTATKNEGVVVYTIGFEIAVNSNAETQLSTCATSLAHYYRAEGININDAFNSIASNVVNLRLTQ